MSKVLLTVVEPELEVHGDVRHEAQQREIEALKQRIAELEMEGEASEHNEAEEHHDSIEAIREAASRVDAIMAMEQLETMKHELSTVTTRLNDRTADIEEFRRALSRKDEHISTLELERDLYKAEAAKMKAEVHKVISQIQNIDAMSVQELLVNPPSEESKEEPRSWSLSFGGSDSVSAISKDKPFLSFRKAEQIRELAPMDDVSQRLAVSLETSEELRRRLAMLSRYYENLVRKLQKELAETRADKDQLEYDLVNQIARIDRAKIRSEEELKEQLQLVQQQVQILRSVHL